MRINTNKMTRESLMLFLEQEVTILYKLNISQMPRQCILGRRVGSTEHHGTSIPQPQAPCVMQTVRTGHERARFAPTWRDAVHRCLCSTVPEVMAQRTGVIYSQEPLSPGLSSVYLSLIWWWHLGLPHFTAVLIVRSRIAVSTSLLLNLAARWILNSQECLYQNFGPGVRNIVFPLQPGEVGAEKWKWMETNQQGI